MTAAVIVRVVVRVRLHIIRNERIENVGKSQSCMVSKLRIICKQIVRGEEARAGELGGAATQPRTGDREEQLRRGLVVVPRDSSIHTAALRSQIATRIVR